MKDNNVKNVLSIDMDYIMAPCINMYNDCAGSEEFKNGDFWTQVNMIRNIDKYLEYEPSKLLAVVDVFTHAIKDVPKNKIMFAEEHDMILELLCREDNIKETFNLYNMDHHHDIYYGPEQKSEIERFDFACLANWVYYLGKNEKLHKYYWIKNDNSAPFDESQISELTFPFDDDKAFKDPAKLREIKFDYVFCCNSSEYFPAKFEYLFEMLIFIAENMKNTTYTRWSKPYCVDGKSRPVPSEK